MKFWVNHSDGWGWCRVKQEQVREVFARKFEDFDRAWAELMEGSEVYTGSAWYRATKDEPIPGADEEETCYSKC